MPSLVLLPHSEQFLHQSHRLIVRLRNAYANANDTITLNSIQMQMSMHQVIVTAIVIMADDKICHDNDSGDDNLMHAHLHLNRK